MNNEEYRLAIARVDYLISSIGECGWLGTKLEKELVDLEAAIKLYHDNTN